MFSFLSDLLRWFGQGLLTRPSSSTDGLSVPGRWRVTWRPRSAEGRLFVDYDRRGSLGSAAPAARRAVSPLPEQMDRKLSRQVRQTRRSNRQERPKRGQRCCWQRLKLRAEELARKEPPATRQPRKGSVHSRTAVRGLGGPKRPRPRFTSWASWGSKESSPAWA